MSGSIESRRRPGQADLKVIGAGLPRTGSLSMYNALKIAYDAPCHHFCEVANDLQGETPFWRDAYERGHSPAEWDEYFRTKGYVGTMDAPTCDFVKTLADLYPEAKIIITTRDEHKWFRSMQSTVAKYQKIPWGLEPVLNFFLPEYRPFFALSKRMFYSPQGATRGQPLSPSVLPNYVDDLLTFFAVRGESHRVLVYSLESGRGWDTICPFLGLPVPSVPWPNCNWSKQKAQDTPTARQGWKGGDSFKDHKESAEFKRKLKQVAYTTYAVAALGAASTAAAVGAALYSRWIA